MEIKSIRTNVQKFIVAEINGATVNINYDCGDSAPSQVNVYASYAGNGVSSNCNRSYSADGTYQPVSENVVYPFNAAFNTSLSSIITAIYLNPMEPVL